MDFTNINPGQLEPYSEVIPDLRFGFEKDPTRRHLAAEVRSGEDLDSFGKVKRYLIADVSNYQGQWFSLEYDLKASTRLVQLRLKAYPLRRLFPKLYFTYDFVDKTLDLPDFPVFEQFNTHEISLDVLTKEVSNLRLALNVPDCQWFTLGLMSAEAHNG